MWSLIFWRGDLDLFTWPLGIIPREWVETGGASWDRGSQLAHCHFCSIRWAKAPWAHRSSPKLRRRKLDSSFRYIARAWRQEGGHRSHFILNLPCGQLHFLREMLCTHFYILGDKAITCPYWCYWAKSQSRESGKANLRKDIFPVEIWRINRASLRGEHSSQREQSVQTPDVGRILGYSRKRNNESGGRGVGLREERGRWSCRARQASSLRTL